MNISELKELVECIYSMTGISCFIRDADGEIIVLTNYNKICEKLHNNDSLTGFSQCEAEKSILESIKKGENYTVYRCKNDLIYIGTPIIINNNYQATLFAGQVFSKEPDIEYFKMQERNLRFDEKDFIENLKEIAVVSEKKL